MEKMDACSILELPAGFRFCPTDEEIIIHYLLNKVLDKRFGALAIGEADLNKTEPWDLPQMAKTGEKERFFFWQRYRKYPTGMRTNRATESGYWKATGKDRNIYKPRKCLVGMKKTLVFYQGRAPKGHRTNWVMHEYRLEGDFSNYDISRAAKEEWVVCRVFHKNTVNKPSPGVDEPARMDPLLNSSTLPPLRDYDQEDELKPSISSSVSMMLENNKLQKTPHDQINLPSPASGQSTNVDPNPGYSIVSHSDGDFTESRKTFYEQQLDDEGLYFDSLWSYWETDYNLLSHH